MPSDFRLQDSAAANSSSSNRAAAFCPCAASAGAREPPILQPWLRIRGRRPWARADGGAVGQRRAQVRITRARSTCQQDDASQSAEIMGSPVQLPEDIFHWIHALMPMRDAAQTACVSRGFLRSWRCYPKLFLSVDSLCIREGPSKKEDITMNFISRVDHIMQNHSGMGVKEFRLKSYPCSSLHPSYLDRWLQVAITPGIKDFELLLFDFGGTKYNFPGSFLSSQRGGSIQSFVLDACSFHSAPQVGCMSSLTNLDFRSVDITGKELYCFLTNSYALEKIVLWDCKPITILKIPCQLQRLNILQVLGCRNLEIIESNAPNLSIFFYDGRQIHVSLGNALQVRKIEFCHDYSPDTILCKNQASVHRAKSPNSCSVDE
ncbi:hypothetical protein ACP4OV_009013 [Aristida adscensionis]